MQSTPSTSTAKPKTWRLWFTPAEWLRLGALYGCIAGLHILGWGLYLYYSAHYPALIGLGLTAYLLGLRHAFDADHIAAVDDSVRFMTRAHEKPLGTGFFFSLGHSTIVFALSVAIVLLGATIKQALPVLQDTGDLIGASVSGAFLWFIGVLNLLVLLDIIKVWRGAKSGRYHHTHVDELLVRRGLIHRLFGGRLQKRISRSWHLYPLGVLFGLSFDTASEVALLAMTAAASAAVLPALAVLSLPILFTAGMTAMDTTDGVLMCKAYNWAFINPARKIYYNLVTTTLGVIVALVIGSIELAQVFIGTLGLRGPLANWIASLGLGDMGYVIVALFLLVWVASVMLWRIGGFRDGHLNESTAHAHEHTHEDGVTHTHYHFH